MNPVVFVALLVLLLAGCKRHETASNTGTIAANQSQTTTDAPVPPSGPPTQAPSEPVVVAENSDVNAILDQLSAELRVYVSRTRSAPKDFQDFVNRAQLQAPAPPAGKSYAIARGKVVLVNQ
ncbi:MAG TPA: hypothetical protein VG754_06805 [Verrucomicrobiae bacterium]|jgi:hypothetical protein|nr:hypothetical protein [Verrucomicrobiae bacterium]